MSDYVIFMHNCLSSFSVSQLSLLLFLLESKLKKEMINNE